VPLTLTKIDLITRTELAGNPADGLGASLVKGTIIRVESVNEMENLDLPAESWALVGGTFFNYDGTDWNPLNGTVNVETYRVSNGTTLSDLATLEAAAASGYHLQGAARAYVISKVGGIYLNPGQNFYGVSSSKFSSLPSTSIENTAVGGGCFWYGNDTSTGQKKMPQIFDAALKADFPVQFNDQDTAIVLDGTSSNVPYGMKPKVLRCDLSPRVSGTGIGVAWTKMFDGEVTDCSIESFDTNILLLGCDLNRVEHNRIINAKSYHILELSVYTFGSQNTIRHNDILSGITDNFIFYKTTARYPRFYNNYLEAVGNDPEGFVDISDIDVPVYNGQAVGSCFGAIITGNRLEGSSSPDAFRYRVQAEGMSYCVIEDGASVGPSTNNYLVFVDAAGNNVDCVPFIFSVLNICYWSFTGSNFNKWNGYITNELPRFPLNGLNLFVVGGVIENSGQANSARARSDLIVLKSGFTGLYLWEFRTELLASINPEKVYMLEIEARAAQNTETLRVGALINGSGTSLQDMPLTTEFSKFSTVFRSGSSGTGVHLKTDTSAEDIEIKSINVTKLYDIEISRFEASSSNLAVDQTFSGAVIVVADNGSGTKSTEYYKFINGNLIPININNDDSAVIAISLSRSGNTFTFTVTGTATTKFISVGYNS